MEYKKVIDGVLYEMTSEEIAEIEAMRADYEQSIADIPAPEPTPEERIAALEEQLAAAKILLGMEE